MYKSRLVKEIKMDDGTAESEGVGGGGERRFEGNEETVREGEGERGLRGREENEKRKCTQTDKRTRCNAGDKKRKRTCASRVGRRTC